MTIVLDGTNGINTPDLESSGQVLSNGLTTSLYPLVSGTAVASTSGTSIDFTGIPSWVKRITVMFNGVSTNGTSALQIQIGDVGGFENTGYVSTGTIITSANVSSNSATSGFLVTTALNTTDVVSGHVVISTVSTNVWVQSGVVKRTTSQMCFGAGDKTLSDTLDRIRITTVNGTDTFDAGSINILYE